MYGIKEALLGAFREVRYKAVSCGQVTKRLIQVTYVAPLTRLSLSLRVPQGDGVAQWVERRTQDSMKSVTRVRTSSGAQEKKLSLANQRT